MTDHSPEARSTRGRNAPAAGPRWPTWKSGLLTGTAAAEISAEPAIGDRVRAQTPAPARTTRSHIDIYDHYNARKYTYINTYIHTYIHTYVCAQIYLWRNNPPPAPSADVSVALCKYTVLGHYNLILCKYIVFNRDHITNWSNRPNFDQSDSRRRHEPGPRRAPPATPWWFLTRLARLILTRFDLTILI